MLTEYSLSVDNLFIFVIIMTSFNVPRVYQRQALFVGIVIALIFRGIFIALGAAAIQRFLGCSTFSAHSWCTPRCDWHAAPRTTRQRRMRRSGSPPHLNVTDTWHGLKLYVKEGSQRSVTPMALVILALGVADLIFALDSIPAIYGLTRRPIWCWPPTYSP